MNEDRFKPARTTDWRTRWDPVTGDRMRPAWQSLTRLLDQDGPTGRLCCIAAMTAASDITPKTCRTMIGNGRSCGWLLSEPSIDGLVQLTAAGRLRWLPEQTA